MDNTSNSEYFEY